MTLISRVIANSKSSRSRSLYLPSPNHVSVDEGQIGHWRRIPNEYHLSEGDCVGQIEVFGLIFRITRSIRLNIAWVIIELRKPWPWPQKISKERFTINFWMQLRTCALSVVNCKMGYAAENVTI